MEEQKQQAEEVKQEIAPAPTAEETKNDSGAAPKADPKDVEKNKVMAILAYFLFFLPLITDAKDSPFAKYHANQGLLLLMFSFGAYLVSSMLVVVLIGFLLLPLASVVSFVFLVLGIINASNGEMKPLPLFGGIQIIK